MERYNIKRLYCTVLYMTICIVCIQGRFVAPDLSLKKLGNNNKKIIIFIVKTVSNTEKTCFKTTSALLDTIKK